jgi:hypothetical protein
MGGVPQQALSTGTSATTIGFVIDYPTPMAEYFLVQRSLSTLAHHQRTARDIPVHIWGLDIQKHKSV